MTTRTSGESCFSVLGAQDEATQCLRVLLEKGDVIGAISFGAGAGLKEQIVDLLPPVLQSDDEDEVLIALWVVEKTDVVTRFLDDICALLEHPNRQIREGALDLLITYADSDESGEVRKRFAEYLSSHPSPSLVQQYFACNRKLDERLLDVLLGICATEGGETARYIVDEIARCANLDSRAAGVILAYQPSADTEKYYRRIIKRLRVQVE